MTGKRAEISVQGIVQGVGFRPFIYRLSNSLELPGTVRNIGDAGVEIVLEGPQEKIREFLDRLPEESPPLSRIQSVEVNYSSPKGLEDFQILESSEGGSGSGTIPPDTAMCDKCLEDMGDPESRYHGYWATSCVDCGPRFTVIRELPYDRPRTSMDEFPMCEECESEYEDPLDRRHHAQTIACPECGPSLFSQPPSEDPISEAAGVIRDGRIAAIKGVGGTHLVCNAFDSEAVERLKDRLRRPHKPLAVMAQDRGMIREFAEFDEREEEALESIKRPIVVLDQLEDSNLAPGVAEGIHNVGVMLPYTGIHHLLFDHIDFPVVMTSANLPGRPMLVENENIIPVLEDVADFMVLHDREIVARCDDSVVRFSGGARKFIRRSRGWAPTPVNLDMEGGPVLALGGEIDNTIALFDGGNCYVSQYLGDVDNLETFDFLQETIDHLLSITNSDMPDRVVCDLHPEFMTSELAEELSEDPLRVQHHHAHIASVLAENGIQEAVGISVDGVGYGPDGSIWGGEVLDSTRSDFERVGSLSPMLMPGGDLATKHPSRMIAGIFHDSSDLSEILKEHGVFSDGEEERETVERQVETGFNTPVTTSAGRFLDAVSSLLGVCHERSYEGEPAMKLESFAVRGEPLDLEPELKSLDGRSVLDVQSLMRDLIDFKEEGKKEEDIAATAQSCLAEGLARIAIDHAKDRGVEGIALSGGVSYNDAISWKIRDMVEESGLEFVTDQDMPSGDGGVSFGQVIVALSSE